MTGGILLVLFLLYLLVSTAVQYYRLWHIKGPFIARFSNWWLLSSILRAQTYLEFTEVNNKYGQLGFHSFLTLPIKQIPLRAPLS